VRGAAARKRSLEAVMFSRALRIEICAGYTYVLCAVYRAAAQEAGRRGYPAHRLPARGRSFCALHPRSPCSHHLHPLRRLAYPASPYRPRRPSCPVYATRPLHLPLHQSFAAARSTRRCSAASRWPHCSARCVSARRSNVGTDMTETFARLAVVCEVGGQRPLSQARAEMRASRIRGAGVSGSARRRRTLKGLDRTFRLSVVVRSDARVRMDGGAAAAVSGQVKPHFRGRYDVRRAFCIRLCFPRSSSMCCVSRFCCRIGR